MSTAASPKPPPRPITRSPFVDSTDILGDAAALRARADEEGYLYFRRFLPESFVHDLRADILAVTDRFGWRVPGQDRLGGLVDPAAIDAIPDEDISSLGTGAACYREVQKLESFHRFPHHPRLMELYRTLFQGEAVVHPRNIARMIVPHSRNFPTPQHQDFPHIQGSANTWTCWIPTGDCPRALGGLTVLRGSHKAGYMPVQPAKGAGGGGFAVQLCPWESQWVEGDFSAGDILTFHSMTVHKALPAQITDRIRLSLDVRYQPVAEPIEERSLGLHTGDITWEEVYRDWKSDDLKYYWRRLPLTISAPFDPGYLEAKRRIC